MDSVLKNKMAHRADQGRDERFAQVITIAPEGTVEARPIAGAFLAMNSGAITVRQERCAKVRNRNVSCLKCADACTSGCISLEENELVIDPTRCVGCGTCATVCPTCALESCNPNDVLLAQRADATVSGGKAVIACHPALEAVGNRVVSDRVAEVVCAGRVEESLLAHLAANGVQEVDIVCGNCERCAQRHGRVTAEMVVESATSLLRAWGNGMTIRVVDAFPETVLADGSDVEAARAALVDYFREVRSNQVLGIEAPEQKDEPEHDEIYDPDAPVNFDDAWTASRHRKKVGKRSFMHVMKDGTLPHFLPDRRERLLNSLFEIGDPQSEKISSRLWGWIVINGAACTSCRMCATFCPTGAIARFDEEDGTFGVRHFPGDCVKCRSCVDICPANAILMFDDVKPSYLMEGETHRYIMRPRETTLGNAQQILSHMRAQMKGSDIFER